MLLLLLIVVSSRDSSYIAGLMGCIISAIRSSTSASSSSSSSAAASTATAANDVVACCPKQAGLPSYDDPKIMIDRPLAINAPPRLEINTSYDSNKNKNSLLIEEYTNNICIGNLCTEEENSIPACCNIQDFAKQIEPVDGLALKNFSIFKSSKINNGTTAFNQQSAHRTVANSKQSVSPNNFISRQLKQRIISPTNNKVHNKQSSDFIKTSDIQYSDDMMVMNHNQNTNSLVSNGQDKQQSANNPSSSFSIGRDKSSILQNDYNNNDSNANEKNDENFSSRKSNHIDNPNDAYYPLHNNNDSDRNLLLSSDNGSSISTNSSLNNNNNFGQQQYGDTLGQPRLSPVMLQSQSWHNSRQTSCLFANVEQLCSKIISKNMREFNNNNSNNDTSNLNGLNCRKRFDSSKKDVLCLFVFGVQGSNEGEILYELVDHSPLTSYLRDKPRNSRRQSISNKSNKQKLHINNNSNNNHNKNNNLFNKNQVCPLYHFTDISVLIEANIDARIAQYRNIRNQTLKTRRSQELVTSSKNDSFSSNENGPTNNNDYNRINRFDFDLIDAMSDQDPLDHPTGKHDTSNKDSSSVNNLDLATSPYRNTSDHSNRNRKSSKCSSPNQCNDNSSPNNSKQAIATACSKKMANLQTNKVTEASISDADLHDFVCLETSNRSLLQMKLFGHSNCVTSHWIVSLIQNHIERYEMLIDLKHKSQTNVQQQQQQQPIPNRVYLIKLIPNHLSLFKGCLFLKQCPSLHNFTYPFQAIKFERRTNIRVFRRECKLKTSNPKDFSSGKRSPFSLSSIKQPIKLTISTLTTSSSSSNKAASALNKLIINTNNNNSKQNITNQQQKITNIIQDKQPPSPEKSSLELLAKEFISQKDEKILIPKLIDHFAQYFDNLNRLTTVRFNPIDNEPATPSDQQSLASQADFADDECPSPLDTPSESNYSNFLALPKPSQNFYSNQSAWTTKLVDSDQNAKLLHQRRTSTSTIFNSRNQHHQPLPIKWAVEIQLVDGTATNDPEISPSNKTSDENASNQSKLWLLGSNNNNKSQNNHLTTQMDVSDGLNHVNSSQSFNNADQLRVSSDCLGEYHEHMTASVSEKSSPGLFATKIIGSSKNFKTKNGNHCYRLHPIRVAYANGQSQLLFELRWSQIKSMKLKSRSDLTRLIKLVCKARCQLENDCKNWLYGALGINSVDFPTNSRNIGTNIKHITKNHDQQQQQQYLSNKHRLSVSSTASTMLPGCSASALGPASCMRHSHTIGNHLNLNNTTIKPSLIVLKIQLDISRLLTDNFSFPANFEAPMKLLGQTTNTQISMTDINSSSPRNLPLKSNLKSPKASNSSNKFHELPNSFIPMSTNKTNNDDTMVETNRIHGSTSSANRLRHVKFKLTDLPRLYEPDCTNNEFAYRQIEHRKWVDEMTFLAYCAPDNRNRLNRSEENLLEVVSELYKYQANIVGQNRARSAIGFQSHKNKSS